MNNQEIPVTDQEQPLRQEPGVHPDTQEQAVEPPGATAPHRRAIWKAEHASTICPTSAASL